MMALVTHNLLYPHIGTLALFPIPPPPGPTLI